MKPQEMFRLLKLTEAQKARELGLLEAAMAEDNRLANEIEEMTRLARHDHEEGGLAFSQISVRLQWAEHKISEARARRVDLESKISQLRANAAKAFGKHKALEQLAEKAKKQAADQILMRTEREATPTGTSDFTQ